MINTYVSLMCEFKKNGKVYRSKFVGTGPSSYKKRIYQAAVSQRLRNTALHHIPEGQIPWCKFISAPHVHLHSFSGILILLRHML